MRIDLHTHSSVSDGTDTPAELVRKALGVGLDVVALTDHDTFDGLDEAVAEGERLGLRVVRGMELSCSRHGSSVHVLAYGADPASPELAAEMARVRDGRLGRLAGVLRKLAVLGAPVSEAAVIAHPWGRGRERLLPPSVLEALARDHGLDGIEVDHQDHDPDSRRRLRALADRLGLLATGSSDYHGTGKLDHDLGCNTTDATVFTEMQRRLGTSQE